MNLATATPREIDEAIADLEMQAWKQKEAALNFVESVHWAAGDRKNYNERRAPWKMDDNQAREALVKLLADENEHFLTFGGRAKAGRLLPAIDAAVAEIARLSGEIAKLEAVFVDRGGWSRFFQLRSTPDARIHDTRWCPGLHRSNLGDLGWHPELSGKSDAEAVEELGPVMCSKCFPSAPPSWRRDPKDLKPADPDACPGEGEAPVEGTVKKQSNWSGVRYYGQCPSCSDIKLLRGGNKLPKHKIPKGK